jgi:hypothetical protein
VNKEDVGKCKQANAAIPSATIAITITIIRFLSTVGANSQSRHSVDNLFAFGGVGKIVFSLLLFALGPGANDCKPSGCSTALTVPPGFPK